MEPRHGATHDRVVAMARATGEAEFDAFFRNEKSEITEAAVSVIGKAGRVMLTSVRRPTSSRSA